MNAQLQSPSDEDDSDVLDQLHDDLMGCTTAQAEAYAKACWLGNAEAAMAAALVGDIQPEAARYGFEFAQRARAEATPCEESAEDLEANISWRPGDDTLAEEYGRDNEGYAVRLQLVLLGRCSYTEADVVAPYLQREALGQDVAMELIDAETALVEAENGGEFTYLLRQGPMFWTDDLVRPDALYNPGKRRVRLDQVHQIWRLKLLSTP